MKNVSPKKNRARPPPLSSSARLITYVRTGRRTHLRRAPLYTKNAPAKCCRACTPYFTRVCAHFNQRPHDWPPQSARRFATGRKSRTKATLSRFCRSPGGSEPSAPSKKSTYAEGHVAHLGASASRLSRGCFQRQSMCPRPAPGFGQPRPIGRLVRAGPATDGHAFRHGVAKTVWAVLSSESGCSSAWVRGQRLRIGRLAPGPQPPTGRRAARPLLQSAHAQRLPEPASEGRDGELRRAPETATLLWPCSSASIWGLHCRMPGFLAHTSPACSLPIISTSTA